MERPRHYQLELFNLAKNENIIAVLPTGSGKTLVATLVINHRLEILNELKEFKLIVFVAPTRILVTQQCDYISKRINSRICKKVKSYSGKTTDKSGLNVEYWKESDWMQEMTESAIFVMTPGVLIGILRKSLLPMEIFDFFIFDECHHARGDSPLAQVCHHIANSKSKPRILGLTASPLIGMKDSFVEILTKLESLLMCRTVFVDEKATYQYGKPTSSTVKFDDTRQFLSAHNMTRADVVKYLKGLTSRQVSLDVINAGPLILWNAWLRMSAIIDLLTIYRNLRTIASQPNEFPFLQSLNLPERSTNNNISELSLEAFRIEDNIGNQTFNFIRDIGSKIKQILCTTEESGAIIAIYCLQTLFTDNEIEDFGNLQTELLGQPIKADFKNLVVGCTVSTVDVQNVESVANGLKKIPFSMRDLAEAELNTCLSIIDTFVALAVVLSQKTRWIAVSKLEKLCLETDNQMKAENSILRSAIYHILVDILKCLDDSTRLMPKVIELGSKGVLTLLPPDKALFYEKSLRLDDVRIGILKACAILIDSVDAGEVFESVRLLPPVKYEVISCSNTSVEAGSAKVRINDNPNEVGPFKVITNKVMTLCGVIYDDPVRRHLSLVSDDTTDILKYHKLTEPEKIAYGIDSDCVTIVFCSLRIHAVALSEFLKKFCVEDYFRRRISDSIEASDQTISYSIDDNDNLAEIMSDRQSRKRKSTAQQSQCLIGGSSLTKQDRILKKFKSGYSNILIATDVAEEGVDVRACNLVVNFDIPSSLKSNIQRRGRGRAKNSHFVTMLSNHEFIESKQMLALQKFATQEASVEEYKSIETNTTTIVKSQLSSKSNKEVVASHRDVLKVAKESIDVYYVPATGARVTLAMAIEALNQYCVTLTAHGYFTAEAIFWISSLTEGEDGEVYDRVMYRCYVLLPPAVPPDIRCITGPLCEKKTNAKSLAAIESIKFLHKYRQLNDFLMPNFVGLKVSKRSGFRFAKSTQDEDIDNNRDELPVGQSATETDVGLDPISDLNFHSVDIIHNISLPIKLIPDSLLLRHERSDSSINVICNTEAITAHSSNEIVGTEVVTVDDGVTVTTSASIVDCGRFLHFYRIRGACICEADHTAIMNCPKCRLQLRGINEVCFAIPCELPPEVVQSGMVLSIREREEVECVIESFSRYVKESDLIQIQRFHQAVLGWESEVHENIPSNMWVSYDYFKKMTIDVKYKLRSDSDWAASGLNAYYFVCPLPFRDGSVATDTSYHELELDDSIMNDDVKWSEFLRTSADEAQVLVHNLIAQEQLKRTTMSSMKGSQDEYWPCNDTDSNSTDNMTQCEAPSKEVLTEHLITRGRFRLCIGLFDDPSSSLKKAEQKRFFNESDDEGDVSDEVPDFSGESDASNKIVLMQISSLLTLFTFFMKSTVKLQKLRTHSHTDRIIVSRSKCGLLGKVRWFLYGLSAPSVLWRIKSLLLSYECRAHVAQLIHQAQVYEMIKESADSHFDSLSVKPHSLKKIPLIMFLEAITPRMCEEPYNYERVEVVGDSALKFVTSIELYRLYPNQQEGFLTRAREILINNIHLAFMAKKLNLVQYIRALSLSNGSKLLRCRPPGLTLNGWNGNRCLWNIHVVTKQTLSFKDTKLDEANSELKSSDNKMNHESPKPFRIQSALMSFKSKKFTNPPYVVSPMKKKTLADVIESIIGIYYLENGIYGAEQAIKGLGAWPRLPAFFQEKQESDNSTVPVICNNPIQLSKDTTFQPATSSKISSSFPEPLKRIALGLVPLPQSSSQTTSDDKKNRPVRNNIEQDIEYANRNINRSRKYVSSSFQVTRIDLSFDSSVIDDFEAIIGYRFQNIHYLEEAMTHCTIPNKTVNQRMEYLGDAVLDFAVITLLYQHQPTATQGELSDQKSDATNNAALGKLSLKLRLYKYLMVYSVKLVDDFQIIDTAIWKSIHTAAKNDRKQRKHMEHLRRTSSINSDEPAITNHDDDIDQKNSENDENMPEDEMDEDYDMTEDEGDIYDKLLEKKPAAVKALADAFEALMAAVYLDSNHSIERIYDVIYHVNLIPQITAPRDIMD